MRNEVTNRLLGRGLNGIAGHGVLYNDNTRRRRHGRRGNQNSLVALGVRHLVCRGVKRSRGGVDGEANRPKQVHNGNSDFLCAHRGDIGTSALTHNPCLIH